MSWLGKLRYFERTYTNELAHIEYCLEIRREDVAKLEADKARVERNLTETKRKITEEETHEQTAANR